MLLLLPIHSVAKSTQSSHALPEHAAPSSQVTGLPQVLSDMQVCKLVAVAHSASGGMHSTQPPSKQRGVAPLHALEPISPAAEQISREVEVAQAGSNVVGLHSTQAPLRHSGVEESHALAPSCPAAEQVSTEVELAQSGSNVAGSHSVHAPTPAVSRHSSVHGVFCSLPVAEQVTSESPLQLLV